MSYSGGVIVFFHMSLCLVEFNDDYYIISGTSGSYILLSI